MAASPPTALQGRASGLGAPPAREGAGQTQAETGGADRDRPFRRRFADRLEIALEHRIHDRRAAALLFELGKPTRYRRAALGDGRQGDETDRGFGLPLQARARDWNRASGSADGP